MMLEHFHRMGTSPIESDVLKITKTARESPIEEKLFWKVALSSALIFFYKRYLHD